MAKHCILIPHRNRNKDLQLCLWALENSAKVCGLDYHAVIADVGSDMVPTPSNRNTSICALPQRDGLWNKPHAVNIGLRIADLLYQPDVVTFIDADCLVMPRFLEGVQRLRDDASLMRLCYRIRLIPPSTAKILYDSPDTASVFGIYVSGYEHFQLGYESYGVTPDLNGPAVDCEGQVWGNSHWSCRRVDLGDLRCDESYVGRGHEDLAFIRDFARQLGWPQKDHRYKAAIQTDAMHAAMCITQTTYESDWHNPDQALQNQLRYEGRL